MRKEHKKMNGDAVDIDALPREQKEIYHRVRRFYDQRPDCNQFSAFWIREMTELENKMAHPTMRAVDRRTLRNRITNWSIWRICEDLTSRLAIEQGVERARDYVDDLAELIDGKYPSRYAFCNAVGLDEGYLSRVLNRKQRISLRKLERILEALSATFVIRPLSNGAPTAMGAPSSRMRVTHSR